MARPQKGSADLLPQKVSRAFFALDIGLAWQRNPQTVRPLKQKYTKRLVYLLLFCR